MLLNVRKFIWVEMIRDGGSFALKFEGNDANQYILFTRIRLTNVGPATKDQHGYHQEKEIAGYDEINEITADMFQRFEDHSDVVKACETLSGELKTAVASFGRV